MEDTGGAGTPGSDRMASVKKNIPQAALLKKLSMAQEFIDRLSIKEGGKVLDLGCGNGDVTALLAKKVGSKGQVTGIDPSTPMIEAARKINVNSNVAFQIGDAENIPSDQFDMIYSNYVTHFVKNKQAMFENVAKKLPSGGIFAFVAILETSQLANELSLSMGADVKKEIEELPGFLMCSMETYDKLAQESGFGVALREDGTDTFVYPHLDAVFKFWSMCTAGKFNPEKADQDALSKLKERYGEQPVDFSIHVARYVLAKK